MKNKVFLTGILGMMLVFGLGFIGCAIPDNGQIDHDIAFVSIKLPTQEDRSAFTDALISQTTAYHLVVTTGGNEVYNDTFPTNQSSINIELTPGSHIFTLNAMKDSEILGTGSTTATLVKGDNSVDIVLTPVKNQGPDDGTYANINVSWQDDELIDQTTGYHLLVAKGEVQVYNNTFPANQSSINIELTPGSHIFTLNAMKDSEILGTGSTTITLVKGDNAVDIVLVPAKGQETDEGTYAHVTVTWEDNEEEFDGVSSGLNWLASNAVEGGNYTITAYADESISPMTLYYNGNNVTITLTGDESPRNISLSDVGAMFTVNAGVTLVLEENIILTGRNDNTDSLVCVGDGGNVVMNDGSEIKGNTSSSQGGGVFIYGSFTMNGGKIINNITNSYYGGGICSYGIFTMNGGTISGNTATNNYGEANVTNGGGGGVFTAGGHFLMTGGTIAGNTSVWGSGVLIFSGNNVDILGTFLKTGGIIYGSDAEEELRNKSGNAVEVEGAAYNNSGEKVSEPIPTKRRITTAGVNVILDSTLTGQTGGWE